MAIQQVHEYAFVFGKSINDLPFQFGTEEQHAKYIETDERWYDLRMETFCERKQLSDEKIGEHSTIQFMQ